MIVEAPRRYPVKSMLGEDLTDSQVSERGLAGDRGLALLDCGTGKVASAKLPRLWQRLLALSAACVADDVLIQLPDGGKLSTADSGVDEALSALLGRPVALIRARPDGAELERAVPEEVLADGVDAEVSFTVSEFGKASPPGTFFDFAPVHLIATATLDRISELSPRGAVEPERYRPNLVIRTDDCEPFAENGWVGRELHIGDELRMKLIVPTPRCAVPTLAHGSLPRDPDALRIPAGHNRVEPLPGLGLLPCVGVYAQVLRPGRIRQGDKVCFG